MVIDDFGFFVEMQGAFKGYNDIVLKSNHAGKKNDSLTVFNHTQKDKVDNIIYVPIYQLNKNDHINKYNIVHTYIKKLLPPKELLKGNQRIFWYKAGIKEIEVSFV